MSHISRLIGRVPDILVEVEKLYFFVLVKISDGPGLCKSGKADFGNRRAIVMASNDR